MLRKIMPSDLGALLAIEKAVHVTPWTEETFKICFQVGYTGWVIELDKQIIGFLIMSMRVDECHILNLGIARPYQHKGWGQKLLSHALLFAKQKGLKVVYLEVRRSNSRAISLYQKMRFYPIGERKDYYPTVSGHEDALIFAKTLQEDSPLTDA